MQEEETRVAQMVSIDVAAKFESLQNEVDLVKNEIKQTLVDLREFLMKNGTIFPQVHPSMPNSAPPTLTVDLAQDPAPEPAPPPAAPATTDASASLQRLPISAHSATTLDSEMLGKYIEWLGSVKRMGVSLQQITPYVEAYEASGYLQPVMVKVILRSMADLDQLTATPPEKEMSTEEYATCVGHLHQIICPSQNGNSAYAAAPDAPLLEQSGGTLGGSHQVDGGELRGEAGTQGEQPESKVVEALNSDG